MIRFFGIILGFVLMVNIAVTVFNSDYGFSSITTLGKEVIRKIDKTIRNFDAEWILVQKDDNKDVDENVNTITIDRSLMPEETLPEIVEQVVEQPPEVRIFWGPFRTKGAANGFASMAESIGGLPTEIIEKNMGKLYVAFVGKSDAIDIAITTFAEQTGMNIKETNVL